LQQNQSAKLITNAVEAIRYRRDLGEIAGSWVDDPAFDATLAEQDTIWQTQEGAEADSAAEKPKATS
jgi:hypothetical protein